MIKKLNVLVVVFLFLVVALPAFAGQLFDSQTAINDALNGSFYLQQNKNGDNLNYVPVPILSDFINAAGQSFGCLVYGQPYGDQSGNQSRFLGHTLYGEDYTNVAFPPDVTHTGYFEDQQWIIRPWKNSDVTTNYNISNHNGMDGSSQYAQNIKQGILVYYEDKNNANNYQIKGESAAPDFWTNVAEYIHVLSPPSQYSWGIGRMFRYNENGQINYVTVPLMPNALLNQQQLILDVEPKTATINVGEQKQYDSYLVFPDGSRDKIKVTDKCTWDLKDPSVAEKVFTNGNEVKGLFRGLKNGTVDVIATLDGQTVQSILQNN